MASDTLTAMINTPDKGIPVKVLSNAKCIVVIPHPSRNPIPRRIHENDSSGIRTTPSGHGSRHARIGPGSSRQITRISSTRNGKTGSRIQQEDWNRGDKVDYRQNYLRRPPSDHEWRQIDGNYVLANHDGVIVSIRQSHHDR